MAKIVGVAAFAMASLIAVGTAQTTTGRWGVFFVKTRLNVWRVE